MKPAFGSKRKARKIQVHGEDDEPPAISNVSKPFKKSALRQSVAIDDLQQASDEYQRDTEGEVKSSKTLDTATVGRLNSTNKKNKKIASRLSFGPGEVLSGDVAEALEDFELFTPKKNTLSRRVIESTTVRDSSHLRGVDDVEQRPTYSKDYLNELKSLTPSMNDMIVNNENGDLGQELSELDGALVVDSNGLDIPYIPSDAEIREKKERRARLAVEHDYIALEDEGFTGHTLSLLPRKKNMESRLVREDEDLGEGFDEFVEDGRIALGKKQEKAARKAHRKQVAEQIRLAEGTDDEDSDNSDAERNAAYEAAQTKAGMDGLHKPDEESFFSAQVPARFAPIPVLVDCVARLRATMDTMERDIEARHKLVADLQEEKGEILAREIEVQALIRQAGEKYATLSGNTIPNLEIALNFQSQSPLAVDRGLESFGHTPQSRSTL